MKYLIAFLTGLLAGVAAAAALIYFNPLSRGQSVPVFDADWTLNYSLDPAENWVITHDRDLALGVTPPDVALLWEAGIRRSMLTAMPLRDSAAGASAAATRISVPSPATEFLRAGLLVDEFWLISVPGQGSVFVHALNNMWPLFRDSVVRVGWLGREWEGPGVYGPTLGPARSGAVVRGLSGELAGIDGRGRERLLLGQYSQDRGLASLSGQLLLELDRADP